MRHYYVTKDWRDPEYDERYSDYDEYDIDNHEELEQFKFERGER